VTAAGTPLQLLVFLFPVLVGAVVNADGALLAAAAVAGAFYARGCWPRLGRWEVVFLGSYVVLLAVLALSLVHTTHLHEGFRLLEKPTQFLLAVPAYFLFRSARAPVALALHRGAAAATLALAGLGLFEQLVLGRERAVGPHNSIIFGDIAILATCIVAAGLLTLRLARWERLLGLGAILLGMFASFLSGSRGSWLMVPVSGVLFAFAFRPRLGASRVLAGLAALIVAAGILAATPNPLARRIGEGIADLRNAQSAPDGSWANRLYNWRDALVIWRASPMMGTGLGDYESDVQALIDKGLSPRRTVYGHAHNMYLDALATTGLLGTSVVVLVLFLLPLRIFLRFWRTATAPEARCHAVVGLVVLAAFAVFGLTEGVLARNAFTRTYAFLVMLLVARLSVEGSPRSDASA
jgi:O-antigen ligase